MRSTRFILTIGLLALPALVAGQTPSADPDKPAPATKPAAATDKQTPSAESTSFIKNGSIDFGFLGSTVDGDSARYNRYRDLSNGILIDGFKTALEKGNWFVDINANGIARKDGRYSASFVLPGTFKGAFQWDEVPELVSTSTRSLFSEITPGVLRVDPDVQNALQTAAGTTPSTLVNALPASLNNFAVPFTYGTRRHVASGSITSFIDKDTTAKFDVSQTNRYGNILYSGTFGFSNQVDIPQPISQHTTNANFSVERQAGPDVLLRAGFSGSYFRNDKSLLVWDNPYRATDLATLGSQGRTVVAPSNNFNVFNASIAVKMPAHSRFVAYTAFGFLDDNGQGIIPYTINAAIPVVALPETTVGGKAHTKNANLSFTSRPSHLVNFEVRYRYYDYNNLTPVFDSGAGVIGAQRVQYDSALQTSTAASPLASMDTARFGGSKQTFSAQANVVLPAGSSLGFGYDRNSATYEDRIFAGSGENVYHVSFDALQTQFVSIHTKYEQGSRRGTGLDTTEMVADGEQPTLQHYDIADRDRKLFTLAASVFPVNGLSVTFSAGKGKDDYPNNGFGLASADHTVYGVNVDIQPGEHVVLGGGFNLDDFSSLQWSRQAAGPAAAQLADASKDWNDTGKDRETNITANLGFINLGDKVSLRFGYDSMRGRMSYIYAIGPTPADAGIATTLTAPVQFNTQPSNDLVRGTFDVSYNVSKRIELGFSYWYEQFKVADPTLDASAIPNLNFSNLLTGAQVTTSILQGYQYLPYKAQTFFGRLLYRW